MKELDVKISQAPFFVNILWFHFEENEGRSKNEIQIG